MSVKVKICGLTRAEDIDYVNTYRPDFAGFVFAPKSRRFVSRETACRLRKMLNADIVPVGVFVNMSEDKIAEIISDGTIEMVQLHGQEDESFIARLRKLTDKPVIKAFRVKTAEDVVKAQNSSADFILLDSGAGTGKKFEWSFIKDVRRQFFLAGGLSADNAAEAIRICLPYALDVSSGVETNGTKDAAKIQRFIEAARKLPHEKTTAIGG